MKGLDVEKPGGHCVCMLGKVKNDGWEDWRKLGDVSTKGCALKKGFGSK